jgi:hypothetical protein
MDSQPKNRKWWWLIGAGLVLWYFAPGAVQSFRQAGAYQQQMQLARARAEANRAAGIPAAPGYAPSGSAPMPVATPAAPSRLAGVWAGQQGENGSEFCRVQLEVRDKGPGEVNGYLKLLCYPTGRYYQTHPKIDASDAFMKAMTPVSAILSGGVRDGGVAFHVDKAIGTSVDGCAITSFSVTPFGTDDVAAEWQKGTCPGGQMTLSRQSK